MSPQIKDRVVDHPGFPRVSGDEPAVVRAGYERKRFSPRERG